MTSMTISDFKDALTRETPIASTGPGSPSEGWPRLLNGLAGAKFKIIGGYQASANALLAMERGEVDASFTSWDTLSGSKPEWLASKTDSGVDTELVKHLADVLKTAQGESLVRWAVGKVEAMKS